jgi:hypothetical protein
VRSYRSLVWATGELWPIQTVSPNGSKCPDRSSLPTLAAILGPPAQLGGYRDELADPSSRDGTPPAGRGQTLSKRLPQGSLGRSDCGRPLPRVQR